MHDNTILCQRLLFSAFGEQGVGSILLERGRLSFIQLRNLLPGMPTQQIAKCLGVLLQHHCVFHSMLATVESVGDERQQRTFYEANQRDILARLRYGRVVALHSLKDFSSSEEMPEELARPVVELLLLHGKLRLGELLDQLLDATDLPDPTRGSAPNGHARANGVDSRKSREPIRGGPPSRGAYASVVRLMLQKRFLRIVTPNEMMSDADRELKHDQAVLQKAQEAYGRMPTAQQIKKVRNEVTSADMRQTMVKKEVEEQKHASMAGLKRRSAGDNPDMPDQKRLKIEDELDESCYLRVNIDHYMLVTRDTQIKNAVRSKYGIWAREVITAALTVVREDPERVVGGLDQVSRKSQTQLELNDFDAKPARFSTAQICQRLPRNFSHKRAGRRPAMVDSCAASRAHGDRSGTWHCPTDDDLGLVRELCDAMAGADSDASDNDDNGAPVVPIPSWQRPWLKRASSAGSTTRSGSEQWCIHFGAIASAIKHGLLEDLILRRFGSRGSTACRLMNLIAVKGHVDEKQLAKFALVPAKEVRALLSELTNQRLLESQEVPRSKSDRSRSIFYYYVDTASWQSMLLSEIYQALGNLMTRMAEEIDSQVGLLARLERSDVAGDVTCLPDADSQDFGRLNLRLEFIKTAIERCDEDRYALEMAEM